MTELQQALIGDSAHTPPMRITEALSEALSHAPIPNAPHTIYQELWHICFWLRMTLDWVTAIETPYPLTPQGPFPSSAQTAAESWEQLRTRFETGIRQAVAIAANSQDLKRSVRCPSLPGLPTRTMTVEDQLISLAAHNAYHFGRIVLLRQLAGFWPPPSGGFSW